MLNLLGCFHRVFGVEHTKEAVARSFAFYSGMAELAFPAPNGEGMIVPGANREALLDVMPLSEWREIEQNAGLSGSELIR